MSSSDFWSLFRTTSAASGACAEASVATSTEHSSSSLFRKAVTPLNGARVELDRWQRSELLNALDGETISLQTVDGIHLDAVWSPGGENYRYESTVIIFHGNGCTLDNM